MEEHAPAGRKASTHPESIPLAALPGEQTCLFDVRPASGPLSSQALLEEDALPQTLHSPPATVDLDDESFHPAGYRSASVGHLPGAAGRWATLGLWLRALLARMSATIIGCAFREAVAGLLLALPIMVVPLAQLHDPHPGHGPPGGLAPRVRLPRDGPPAPDRWTCLADRWTGRACVAAPVSRYATHEVLLAASAAHLATLCQASSFVGKTLRFAVRASISVVVGATFGLATHALNFVPLRAAITLIGLLTVALLPPWRHQWTSVGSGSAARAVGHSVLLAIAARPAFHVWCPTRDFRQAALAAASTRVAAAAAASEGPDFWAAIAGAMAATEGGEFCDALTARWPAPSERLPAGRWPPAPVWLLGASVTGVYTASALAIALVAVGLGSPRAAGLLRRSVFRGHGVLLLWLAFGRRALLSPEAARKLLRTAQDHLVDALWESPITLAEGYSTFSLNPVGYSVERLRRGARAAGRLLAASSPDPGAGPGPGRTDAPAAGEPPAAGRPASTLQPHRALASARARMRGTFTPDRYLALLFGPHFGLRPREYGRLIGELARLAGLAAATVSLDVTPARATSGSPIGPQAACQMDVLGAREVAAFLLLEAYREPGAWRPVDRAVLDALVARLTANKADDALSAGQSLLHLAHLEVLAGLVAVRRGLAETREPNEHCTGTLDREPLPCQAAAVWPPLEALQAARAPAEQELPRMQTQRRSLVGGFPRRLWRNFLAVADPAVARSSIALTLVASVAMVDPTWWPHQWQRDLASGWSSATTLTTMLLVVRPTLGQMAPVLLWRGTGAGVCAALASCLIVPLARVMVLLVERLTVGSQMGVAAAGPAVAGAGGTAAEALAAVATGAVLSPAGIWLQVVGRLAWLSTVAMGLFILLVVAHTLRLLGFPIFGLQLAAVAPGAVADASRAALLALNTPIGQRGAVLPPGGMGGGWFAAALQASGQRLVAIWLGLLAAGLMASLTLVRPAPLAGRRFAQQLQVISDLLSASLAETLAPHSRQSARRMNATNTPFLMASTGSALLIPLEDERKDRQPAESPLDAASEPSSPGASSGPEDRALAATAGPPATHMAAGLAHQGDPPAGQCAEASDAGTWPAPVARSRGQVVRVRAEIRGHQSSTPAPGPASAPPDRAQSAPSSPTTPGKATDPLPAHRASTRMPSCWRRQWWQWSTPPGGPSTGQDMAGEPSAPEQPPEHPADDELLPAARLHALEEDSAGCPATEACALAVGRRPDGPAIGWAPGWWLSLSGDILRECQALQPAAGMERRRAAALMAASTPTYGACVEEDPGQVLLSRARRVMHFCILVDLGYWHVDQAHRARRRRQFAGSDRATALATPRRQGQVGRLLWRTASGPDAPAMQAEGHPPGPAPAPAPAPGQERDRHRKQDQPGVDLLGRPSACSCALCHADRPTREALQFALVAARGAIVELNAALQKAGA
ncbi:hypothetical protein H696_00795 [Fonticula alba]|uniref:Uncharacterized protein n=1 Tax=Fonticula alba TaxID=691883 RepID=A0A058ZFW8_FONAL|nr:hypothetical protein H696_00795 [Fonticula alba]KCV73254.1 hypothetical protein H696_00795 [Fonticula alba]|eukprot:XP_009492955.1 hypothetical protein H696_00795 [Fonticula alba]